MFATNGKGKTNLKSTLSSVKLIIGKVLNNLNQVMKHCVLKSNEFTLKTSPEKFILKFSGTTYQPGTVTIVLKKELLFYCYCNFVLISQFFFGLLSVLSILSNKILGGLRFDQLSAILTP